MKSLALALALLVVAGCSSRPPSFVSTAESAPTLTVRKGLPRENEEAKPSDEPTLKVGDQTLYSAQHPVTGDDARAIAKLLADPALFTSHVSTKKCGGFHADYGVAWIAGGEPLQVLLCFGCNEVRAIEGTHVDVYDITEDGESRLEAALGKAVAK